MRLFWTLVMLTSFSINAWSQVRVISETTHSYKNTLCDQTQSCDLKELTFVLTNYEVGLEEDDFNFGTHLIAAYQTQTVADLENYVWVSFIRGCRFDSSLKESGEIFKDTRGFAMKSFDLVIPFMIKDWIINSVDKDPAFFTSPGYLRHDLYYWSQVPGDYSQSLRNLYKDMKPIFAELYVKEMPNQVWYSKEYKRAINHTLEHRMCLYKKHHVPPETIRTDLHFAAPIYCYEWKNNWVYDHKLQTYTHPEERDPVCL